VIDGTSPDPVGDWSAINLELELFNPALKDKPQVGYHSTGSVDVPSYLVNVMSWVGSASLPSLHYVISVAVAVLW
jgi:GTP-binding protein